MTNPVTGKEIWYYEIEIKPFTQQVYPNLKPAKLVGYDGMSPGPTIVVPKGTETVVRFLNNASVENSVHLHGSPSRAPFDGWAEDITRPGQYKDYYYPNYQSARFLWYHVSVTHHLYENQANCNAGPRNACCEFRHYPPIYSSADDYRLPKTRTWAKPAPISSTTLLKMPLAFLPVMEHLISHLSSHQSTTTQTVQSDPASVKMTVSGATSSTSTANRGHSLTSNLANTVCAS